MTFVVDGALQQVRVQAPDMVKVSAVVGERAAFLAPATQVCGGSLGLLALVQLPTLRQVWRGGGVSECGRGLHCTGAGNTTTNKC